MHRWAVRAVLVALLSSFVYTAALAQGTTGSILGTASDQSQAVLPGVGITATDRDTGQKRQTVTDDQGRYVLAQMKVGNYTVQAELPGFQTGSRDVTLTLEGDTVVNFTLTVGAAATEVTVTSEAPMVETTSSSVRGLVDQQQIRDLPLNGRSFSDLATMQTGVILNYTGSRTQVGNEGTKMHVAGTRQHQTLFQLDGTDIRNSKSATPGSVAGVLLGVDTVQEFSVTTSVTSAEYGHFSGGVVNAVTKSGTNAFHGTLFEFLRNSAMDSRNFFDRNPANPLVRSNPPPFRRNQFGYTLGGPIKPNKLFFFTSFESLRDRLTTTATAGVPSLDARRGFIPSIGQLALSPITKPILDAYPLPNSTVRTDGTADYVYQSRSITNERYIVAKVDWQINDKDSFAARYTYDHAERIAPFAIDVVYNESPSDIRLALLEWRRIISPKLINEARVSLNRSFNGNNAVEYKPLPAVMHFNKNAFTFKGAPWKGQVTAPGLTGLAFSSTFGQLNTLNRFQYIDNLTFSTGAHSLKAGFNIHRIRYNNAAAPQMSGQYDFNTLRDLITAAQPRAYSGTLTGVTPRGMRQWIMGFYAQDDWRLRSNVTLNLGLRYEPFTLPREVLGRLGNVRQPTDRTITTGNPLFTVNPSLKNFAPRVGFAWDPFGDGKTSIRAGYGLFFDLIHTLHYGISVHANAPYSIRISLPATTGGPVPFPDPTAGVAGVSQLLSPWAFSDTVEQSSVHQYQLSIQRELVRNLAVQASYTGSRGYNLGHLLDRNTALPQRDAQGGYPFFPAGSQRRNSAFTQMRDFAWDGSSFYDAFGLSVKKQHSSGYSFQVAYTFGKSIDDGSVAGTGEDVGGQPNGLSTFTDDVALDRGLSGFDVRNRVVVSGSWDLPFGAGRSIGNGWNKPLQVILGGWSLNGIVTMADGSRTSLRIGFNHSRSAQTTDVPDRPSLIPGGNNNPVLGDGRDPNRYYDGLQFILGPPGYFGNVARDTLLLPNIRTMDASIQKNFPITETAYVQFRAEMFNLGNRANFGTPANTPIQDAAGTRNPTAGRITATTTSSRQVQFALKIYF